MLLYCWLFGNDAKHPQNNYGLFTQIRYLRKLFRSHGVENLYILFVFSLFGPFLSLTHIEVYSIFTSK